MSAWIEGVIDLSHFQQGPIDFARLKGQGLLGVIHKATDGTAFVDPLFATRRAEVQAAGLLFGAYHFGRPAAQSADGAAQALHFLATVGDPTGLLLALDYEEAPGPQPAIMALSDARLFLTTVAARTGRAPFFYTDCSLPDRMGTGPDPVLGRSRLWLAGYRAEAALRVQQSWSGWTLWQYSDGTHPAAVPLPFGIRCDHDRFCGTADQLPAIWAA